MVIILVFLVISLLIFCAGFLSASETALLAASRVKLFKLKKNGSKKAKYVEFLQTHIEQVIAALVMYNNLAMILASSLATSLLISLFGEAGVAYATCLMTILVLFFGEVVPKMFAVNNPENVALKVSSIVRGLVWAARPLTGFLRYLAQRGLSWLGIQINPLVASISGQDELKGVIDYHVDSLQGVAQESHMLRSILELATVTVGEIIVHRKNVAKIDGSLPTQKIIDEALASPYSRLPIWKDNPDNILGILHIKELLKAMRLRQRSINKIDILTLATPPWFIPETTKLLDQLQAFRNRHEHFALVVDEYGALLGTVTLEDILEEIVGDITDEYDVTTEGIVKENGEVYLVEGYVTIRDLNRYFSWDLPDEEASTLGGLVLYETKRIPEKGQVFLIHGLRIEIVERTRSQIKLLRVGPGIVHKGKNV